MCTLGDGRKVSGAKVQGPRPDLGDTLGVRMTSLGWDGTGRTRTLGPSGPRHGERVPLTDHSRGTRTPVVRAGRLSVPSEIRRPGLRCGLADRGVFRTRVSVGTVSVCPLRRPSFLSRAEGCECEYRASRVLGWTVVQVEELQRGL